MSGEESADAALLSPTEALSAGETSPSADVKKEDTTLVTPDDAPRPTSGSVWFSLPYLQSYVYFSLYIALGFAVGSTGPTLELLSKNVNSTMDETGMVFTARGIGWIAGSLFAGAFNIFEDWYLSPHRLMLISAASLASYLLIIPWITRLWLLLFFALISSVFCSFIDVGANALLFAVWKDKVGPWMQALHFFFGIGASLAPAVVAVVMKSCAPERQLLVSAYVLAFGSLFTAVLPALIKSPKVGKGSGASGHGGDGKTHGKTLSKSRELILVVMTAMFLFFYVGIESSYGGWIFTYARENFPSMPEWEAASLSSAFWIAITAGRLLAVPLTLRMLNRHLLLMDLLISLPVGIVLVASSFVSVLRSKLVLWAMTFLYGIGMASIFATAFSLPSELGLEISTSASSWFIVGGSTGDMAVPAILGFLVVRWSVSLAWAVLGGSIALLALYIGLIAMMRRWSVDAEKPDSVEAPMIAHEQDKQSAISEPGL